MTVTPDIITDAYRESNILSIVESPTAAQTDEGLKALRRIVSGVYGFEVGDPLMDWPIGTLGLTDDVVWTQDQWTYPPPDTRFIAASADAQTIFLVPNPSDGSRIGVIDPLNRLAAAPITIDANGRAIEGAATAVINTDGLIRLWLYRADRGEWVRVSDLTGAEDEVFPFPDEFDDFFITKLAMRVNPRYGRSLSEESIAALNDTEQKLQSRYRQDVTVWGDPATAFMTWGYGDDRYIRAGQLVGDTGNAMNFGRRYRPSWMN